MATNFHDFLAQVGLRINALAGVTAPDLNVTYATRPLTAAIWRSARFPFQSAIDALVDTEGEIAQVIADTSQHRLRNLLEVDSTSLVNGATVPQSISGAQVIGKNGSVRDTTSGRKCTEKTFEEVQRKNETSFFVLPRHHYKIVDGVLFHTRPAAIVKLPVFDRNARVTVANANGAVLFDSLGFLYVSGALAKMTRDGQFIGQSQMYLQHYQNGLAQIQAGTGVNPLPDAPMVSPES